MSTDLTKVDQFFFIHSKRVFSEAFSKSSCSIDAIDFESCLGFNFKIISKKKETLQLTDFSYRLNI
jgi:hypothetical protein